MFCGSLEELSVEKTVLTREVFAICSHLTLAWNRLLTIRITNITPHHLKHTHRIPDIILSHMKQDIETSEW